MPSIAIIGASSDPAKFGNKSVKVFLARGYKVYPINPKEDVIEGQKVYRSILDVPEKNLDMISFYLPPPVGLKVIEEVAKKGCKELWLNPGSESPELVAKAEGLGLYVIQACSIVGVT